MTRAFSLIFHGYWESDTLPDILPESAIFCVYSSKVEQGKIRPDRLLYISATDDLRSTILEISNQWRPQAGAAAGFPLLFSIATPGRSQQEVLSSALIAEHAPVYNVETDVDFPSQPILVFLTGKTHGMQASFFLSGKTSTYPATGRFPRETHSHQGLGVRFPAGA